LWMGKLDNFLSSNVWTTFGEDLHKDKARTVVLGGVIRQIVARNIFDPWSSDVDRKNRNLAQGVYLERFCFPSLSFG
jgi:hypothetical protein